MSGCAPRIRPQTATSAWLRSASVGSPFCRRAPSLTTRRNPLPSFDRADPVPALVIAPRPNSAPRSSRPRDQGADRRVPPGEVDAGALRIRLRPRRSPRDTRPAATAARQLDVDAGVVCRNPVTSRPRCIRHLGAHHPAGQDLLEAVLPQGEPELVAASGKSLMSSAPRRSSRPGPSAPLTGTVRRRHADQHFDRA